MTVRHLFVCMASRTATGIDEARPTVNVWAGAAIAGLAGGLVFGAMMQLLMPDILEMAIPGMFGLGPSLAIGWGIHLVNGAVFGLVYAAIARFDPLAAYAEGLPSGIGLGIVYGVVIWAIAASIVMPLWVGAMTPMSPPVPDVNPASLVGHAVFGAILGALYPLLSARA